MSQRPPKQDPRAPSGPAVPPSPPANYSDELTDAQAAALCRHAPRDEAKMGPLVHEFTW